MLLIFGATSTYGVSCKGYNIGGKVTNHLLMMMIMCRVWYIHTITS